MIDRKPAVGRYIVFESKVRFAKYGSSAQIIRIEGRRYYYKHPMSGKEQCSYVFAAITDTKEEADKLQNFSVECVHKIMNLSNTLWKSQEALLQETVDEKTGLPPA